MSEVQNPTNPDNKEVTNSQTSVPEVKKRVYKCKDCGAEFDSKKALLRHRRKEHGVTYNWYTGNEEAAPSSTPMEGSLVEEEPEEVDHAEARRSLADKVTNWFLNNKNEVLIGIGLIVAAIVSGVVITHYRNSKQTASETPVSAEAKETQATEQAEQVIPQVESGTDDL